MKLIIVRHGQTEANVDGVLQGKSADNLTKKGIEQAKSLGKYLKEKYEIDMVFCSPLKRCVETLEYVLDECPIEGPILMSKLIEERDFGEYTGIEHHTINWDEINQDNKINKELGIESLTELKKRTDLFLEDLKLEDNNATILVLSHSGPIRMMINKLTEEDYKEIKIENALPREFILEI
ncbi:MAG: histidine phosphatase family protein [Candidatus Shapirobacteria bacterium]